MPRSVGPVSDIRIRDDCLSEVEQADARLVANAVDRKLERVTRIRDARQGRENGRKHDPSAGLLRRFLILAVLHLQGTVCYIMTHAHPRGSFAHKACVTWT